jgi:hypothetical protein
MTLNSLEFSSYRVLHKVHLARKELAPSGCAMKALRIQREN